MQEFNFATAQRVKDRQSPERSPDRYTSPGKESGFKRLSPSKQLQHNDSPVRTGTLAFDVHKMELLPTECGGNEDLRIVKVVEPHKVVMEDSASSGDSASDLQHVKSHQCV